MSSTLRAMVLSSTEVGRRSIAEGLLPVSSCTLVGIVTTPETIAISYAPTPVTIRTHARFDDLAARAGCEVFTLDRPPSVADYTALVDRLRPDVLFVLGWYYKVPRTVRARVPQGCLGIHGSLLPKYRGGAPLVWAVINGERETGVTLFHLEDEMDAGDMVAQRAFAIGPDDTCAEVIARAGDASAALLTEELPRLADGTAARIPQRASDATVFPQRAPDDGRIDWRWSARRVHDFVRAQTRPYGGAFTCHGGRRVHLWKASVATSDREGAAQPGAFRVVGEALRVICGDGAIDVHELGWPGEASGVPTDLLRARGVERGAFDQDGSAR